MSNSVLGRVAISFSSLDSDGKRRFDFSGKEESVTSKTKNKTKKTVFCLLQSSLITLQRETGLHHVAFSQAHDPGLGREPRRRLESKKVSHSGCG